MTRREQLVFDSRLGKQFSLGVIIAAESLLLNGEGEQNG